MIKKQKMKKKAPEPKIEIGISHSNVQSFLDKFKADVAGKVKKYREFAKESKKKKK